MNFIQCFPVSAILIYTCAIPYYIGRFSAVFCRSFLTVDWLPIKSVGPSSWEKKIKDIFA